MRETVQGVKRVGLRRSNGEGFPDRVGSGGEASSDRREAESDGHLLRSTRLVSNSSLVGLCDRLGGGQTRRGAGRVR